MEIGRELSGLGAGISGGEVSIHVKETLFEVVGITSKLLHENWFFKTSSTVAIAVPVLILQDISGFYPISLFWLITASVIAFILNIPFLFIMNGVRYGYTRGGAPAKSYYFSFDKLDLEGKEMAWSDVKSVRKSGNWIIIKADGKDSLATIPVRAFSGDEYGRFKTMAKEFGFSL
ncbi:hypothetical protein FUAX_46900 (plasmid) [Fulvitalea axinellae]|uniref:YcxB-like C-terminal domain-containing protein n=1 Tax=Fulvitalea axinellae TaxID=1182444 RepID=A0AAU9CW83_9BACT|nr:hypothetical protein FUAX_46900 [Fulvitalea axinellae]